MRHGQLRIAEERHHVRDEVMEIIRLYLDELRARFHFHVGEEGTPVGKAGDRGLAPIGKFNGQRIPALARQIQNPSRAIVCINDVSMSAGKQERMRLRLHRAFEERLPLKSRFEK